MNDGLEYYKHEDKVWHINGYSEVNFEQRQDEISVARYELLGMGYLAQQVAVFERC